MKSFNKKQIWIDIVVVLSAISFVCLFSIFPTRHLSENHRYTVATIIEIDGNGAKITYSVAGSVFKGSMDDCCKADNSYYKIGERIFIMFYPIDPNESQIVFDKIVPDTLNHIPNKGWEKLPI